MYSSQSKWVDTTHKFLLTSRTRSLRRDCSTLQRTWTGILLFGNSGVVRALESSRTAIRASGRIIGIDHALSVQKRPSWPVLGNEKSRYPGPRYQGGSDAFTFGFDWHWRAEDSPMGRGSCATTSWKKSVKSLHDKFSADVLALLPLPFNVVFGECAPKHYERAPIRGQRRLFPVPVFPGTNLAFALHFNAGKMKRMTVFIEHPATVFFGRPPGANHSVRIHVALTFLLWLLRKEHDRYAFQKLCSRHRRGLPLSLPP